jgi:nucleotidyltransferase substrate binding protein (TIGR01987 family)
VHGPRPVIKEAFSAGLLRDGEGWINMLEDRNRTSHIYDENEARQIYERITSLHLGLLRQLPEQIGSMPF